MSRSHAPLLARRCAWRTPCGCRSARCAARWTRTAPAAPSPYPKTLHPKRRWSGLQVRMADGLRLQISEVCSLLDVDGIRGDMTVNKAATALAALEARDEVTPADVQRVIALCLNHRRAMDFRVTGF